MTQLSAAETKFFDSRGTDVDPSLTSGGGDSAPSEPAPSSTPAPASGNTPSAPAAGTLPAAPPAAAPATPPADPARPPEGFVSQQALHAERQRRQQMETEFRTLQQQFQQMQQFLERAQQPADERPDPEADPFGAIQWDNRQLRQQIEQINQRFGQQDQVTQRQQQVQRLTQHLTASEQALAKTQPDYFQAADYAIRREDLRLQAFYPDPAVRARIMQQEIANIVAQSIQNGMNPAQMIYQHAINMGYTRAAAAAGAPGAGAPGAPGGAAPQPAPATGAASAPAIPPTVSEAQAAIARGLEQQSRSGGGGSTPPSELTPQMLLAMDGEEFTKNWDKVFRKK